MIINQTEPDREDNSVVKHVITQTVYVTTYELLYCKLKRKKLY